MTPLILPALHNKLVEEVRNGRRPPIAQVIVSMFPDGRVVVDACVANRTMSNAMMETAKQDLAAAFVERELKPQEHGEIKVANQAMVDAVAHGLS